MIISCMQNMNLFLVSLISMEVLMMVFFADYESFSFDPIQTDFLFEYCKSEFVEFEIIAAKNFALDQTHTHIGLNRLVKFTPPILP